MRQKPTEEQISDAERSIGQNMLLYNSKLVRLTPECLYICEGCDYACKKMPPKKKCPECGRRYIIKKRQLVSNSVKDLLKNLRITYFTQPEQVMPELIRKCKEAGVDPHAYLRISE